jgi:hypothetical protein
MSAGPFVITVYWPANETKIAKLRTFAAAGNWRAAMAIAAKFPSLGLHKTAIMGAWEAFIRPDFQRQLGKNPEQLISAGIAALKEKYHV